MKVCSWAMRLTNSMIERCKEAEYDAIATRGIAILSTLPGPGKI